MTIRALPQVAITSYGARWQDPPRQASPALVLDVSSRLWGPAAHAANRDLVPLTGLDPAVRDHVLSATGATDLVASTGKDVLALGARRTADPVHLHVFCWYGRHRAVVAGTAPATTIREWDDALAIKPRGGVNAGHTLVIPRRHVDNAVVDPAITVLTMARAAELGAEYDCDLNLITSVGQQATQSVFHLHIHLVPRVAGDELPLPWTPQHAARVAAQDGVRT